MKVVLASKNKHKLEEISKITEKFGFELILQSQLGVDIDVDETGTTAASFSVSHGSSSAIRCAKSLSS